MINVFQLADNDQSIYYLGQIFGNVGFALSGTGPALLSQLFKVFNTIMLVVAVIIVTYVSVIGVMKTAAEGEVLGKGWSTLWVPLRTVAGIAALMPTTTGYCAAQVIIMWFIVQGIGAADTLWTAAVKYFASGGGIMSAPPPSPTDITGAANNIWTTAMQNLICQSTATKFFPQNENASAHTRITSQAPGQNIVFSFGNNNAATTDLAAAECGTLILPPDGTTTYTVTHNGEDKNTTGGSVTFSDGTTVSVPSSSYPNGVSVSQASGAPGRQAGLLTAYQTAFPTLEVIADFYVKSVIDDPKCWTVCPNPGSCQYFGKWAGMNSNNFDNCFFGPVSKNSPLGAQGSTAWNAVLTMAGSNFLLDVTKLFTGEASNYASTYQESNMQSVSGTSMSNVDEKYQKAQVNGWVYAGSYYYMLSGRSNSAQDSYIQFLNASKITLFDVTTAPDFKNLEDVDPPMPILKNSSFLTSRAADALNASTSASGGGLLLGAGQGGPSGALSASGAGIEKMWMNAISPGSGSPVAKIQSFGHNLLLAADILCITFFGTSIVLGFLTGNIIELGFSVNPFYGAVLQGLSLLTTALFFLVAYMVTIGGILGVYVPLIPFVLFMMGVIGWMIVAIEAVIAGPIVAIGLLSPGGQHEIFSRAEPAIFLTLNLMLRPTLMLLGMFAAMLLSGVVVTFINSVFFSVVSSFNGTESGGYTYSGMFETFIYIVAYVGLIVTALNKCFELIHHVPDRALHWIGHQAASAGEQQALGEVKGKVAAGGEAGAGAGKATGGQVAGQAQAHGKAQEEGGLSKGAKQKALDDKEGRGNPRI
jgi:conjugal transfer/type IV secretion protein DotA/TraY